MKVHQQFPRGFWDLHLTHTNSSPCTNRHLRPLAPKLDAVSPQDVTRAPPQVESQAGGTRWNPTQEQIGILEMLYSRGMRTPNSQQIEHVAVHLSQFGKIQGKNVFYWFQNHKARERQKLKRLSTPRTASFSSFDTSKLMQEKPGIEEPTTSKKKRTSWTFEGLIEESSRTFNNKEEEDGSKKTLELFPLHPEARQMD